MGYELKTGERLSHGIRRIEKRQVGRIMDQLEEKRPDEEGKAIHETRKNLKKARAALRLIRNKLDAGDYRKENRNFRKVGQALSLRRDAEVLLKTVDKLNESRSDRRTNEMLVRLHEVLLRQHEEIFRQPPAVGKIKAELQAARRHIKDWQLSGLKWADLSRGSQRTYKQGRKAFHKAEQMRTPANLHEWRKRVKDLWYQLRILEPACPAAIAQLVHHMKRLSDYLGDDHDLAMLKETVRRAQLDQRQIKLLDEIVDSRRGKLEKAAFELGHRVYAGKPAVFARRIKRCGKNWRCC